MDKYRIECENFDGSAFYILKLKDYCYRYQSPIHPSALKNMSMKDHIKEIDITAKTYFIRYLETIISDIKLTMTRGKNEKA